MDATHKKYLGRTLGLTALAMALVAVLNMLIDPPGAYPRVNLKSFEGLRYLQQPRVFKAELARRGGWRIAIIGSSRAKGSMPRLYPFFATNETCNLSVDAARVPELKAIFDYVRQTSELEHVFLCLDFYMFAPGTASILDFSESRFNPRFNRFAYHCKRLLSKSSLDDTWETIRKKRAGHVPDPQETHGFLKLTLPRVLSQRVLFGNTLKIMAEGYARHRYEPRNLELVSEIAAACRERRIQLHVAILPVHALDLEMLHGSGRWPEFEAWQRGLVAAVGPQAEGVVQLWDFTSFLGPPAERVPRAGDETTRMAYYFENSHCTPVLGTNILNRMLGVAGEDFGAPVDSESVDAHLAKLRDDRAAFLREHPEDAAWARGILEEAIRRTRRPGGLPGSSPGAR